MRDLVRPFAFLTIRHPSRLPLWVSWLLPLLLTVAATVGLAALDTQLDLFGAGGLLARLLGFVQTLAGFYIAALAAVAAFNSPYLDRVMPYPPPTLRIRYNGALQDVELTRRRFLTSMFACLTALSFVFSLAAIVALTVAAPMRHLWPMAAAWSRWPLMACFVFALAQLTLITFWGLFYLGERMLTPD